MDTKIKDRFITLWQKYFGNVELPIACYYSETDNGIPVVPKPTGHSCFIAQLLPARRGGSLCFQTDSVNCGGGKMYLGFTDKINDRFEYFLSNGEDGGICEKYKQSPELVRTFINRLPTPFIPGKNLICKRWDKLEAGDHPDIIIFFASPDVLSGLFTLAVFDTDATDAVITPFGAGCTSIIYYPYLEHIERRERAVIGMFDISARKCVKENILSFAVPINKFLKMTEQIENCFLTTDSWNIIKKRINQTN